MRVLVARLGWSSFGWRGLPPNPNATQIQKYSNDVSNASMEYIRENGYGDEWWTFDEDFCNHFDFPECDDKYYYGTVPAPDKIEKTLLDELKNDENLIFFISKPPHGTMKLVGIYSHAKYIDAKDAYVKSDYRRALAAYNIPSFSKIDVIFIAPKKYSLVFPENAKEINQSELFGIKRIRQFGDLRDATTTLKYDMLIDILQDIKKKLSPVDQAKIDRVIKILKAVKSRVSGNAKLAEGIFIHENYADSVDVAQVYRSLSLFPFASYVTREVNIYCVASQILDEVCPPEKKEYIDPECLMKLKEELRSIFKKVIDILNKYAEKWYKARALKNKYKDIERYFMEEGIPELREVWNDIEETLLECKKRYEKEEFSEARGCYTRLTQERSDSFQQKYNIPTLPGPAIFLAIDRIEKVSKDISSRMEIPFEEVFSTIFDIVILHEAFHAYMDSFDKKIKVPLREIIEESLATYTSYMYITPQKRAIFLEYLRDHPFEYISSEYWNAALPTKEAYYHISLTWAQKVSPFIPDPRLWMYIIKRFYPNISFPPLVSWLASRPLFSSLFKEPRGVMVELLTQFSEVVWGLIGADIIDYMLR